MIYLKLQLTKGYYKVILIHRKPFDRFRGLGKTEEELLLEGIFVEAIPSQMEYKEGFYSELRVNKQKTEVYYEYVSHQL